MPSISRAPLVVAGLALALAGNAFAQETEDDPHRASLMALRNFAVHARVQLSDETRLPRIDERLLRAKLASALRREGISEDRRNDVRDGSAAQLSLLYLVIETRDPSGEVAGFAAHSCLEAVQTVLIPRLTTAKHIEYAVVPTWRSCSMLAGNSVSYADTILRNADDLIARFLNAWRLVNRRPPAPPSELKPELGTGPVRGAAILGGAT